MRTPIAVSKDEWDTKEDIDEECIVRTAVCQKARVRLKLRTLNSEKSSP